MLYIQIEKEEIIIYFEDRETTAFLKKEVLKIHIYDKN